MDHLDDTGVRHPDTGKPWWKFPIVWLVVGGPLLVVVAALITVVIAVRHVDPVLDTSAAKASSPGEAPALQGRNRAAENATRPTEGR